MTSHKLPGILLVCLLCFLSGRAMAADGDYLSELAAEVEKVEEQALGEDEAPDVGTAPGEAPPTAGSNASREAFERQLQKRYLGSYGFYKRLPERSRQEVYEEYRQGADMQEIRKKIISRLLNR